jgi:hypothetical protein
MPHLLLLMAQIQESAFSYASSTKNGFASIDSDLQTKRVKIMEKTTFNHRPLKIHYKKRR